MISKRRGCRWRKCTTVPHGGIGHRTLTPHESGNKMKRKKKKIDNANNLLGLTAREMVNIPVK